MDNIIEIGQRIQIRQRCELTHIHKSHEQGLESVCRRVRGGEPSILWQTSLRSPEIKASVAGRASNPRRACEMLSCHENLLRSKSGGIASDEHPAFKVSRSPFLNSREFFSEASVGLDPDLSSLPELIRHCASFVHRPDGGEVMSFKLCESLFHAGDEFQVSLQRSFLTNRTRKTSLERRDAWCFHKTDERSFFHAPLVPARRTKCPL